jgi:RNA polymerase sigma-70 factor (ECF subfamily)
MTCVSTFRHGGPATLNYGLFGGCIGQPYGSTAVWPERRVADDSSDSRLSALMTAAQAGDRTAYAVLLRECVPVIRRVATRRAPADRVDDVVQDVLLTLHNARHTYDPSRSFTAWLTVISDRRAIDLMRRVVRDNSREVHAPLRYEQHPDLDADPAAPQERNETAKQVRQAVETLPQRQREAVQHVVLGERSLKETSAITGQSEGSIKVSLHRALRALRLKIEHESQ